MTATVLLHTCQSRIRVLSLLEKKKRKRGRKAGDDEGSTSRDSSNRPRSFVSTHERRQSRVCLRSPKFVAFLLKQRKSVVGSEFSHEVGDLSIG